MSVNSSGINAYGVCSINQLLIFFFFYLQNLKKPKKISNFSNFEFVQLNGLGADKKLEKENFLTS